LSDQRCFFTYHEVLATESKYRYRVSNAAFAGHLFRISSILKLSPAAMPVVSFDDGHRSNYEQAFPILERFRVKATFFVLAGCIGKSANYMSWTQVREICAAGHHLQSHGWSHRILTQCGASELNHELTDSKHEIEQRLGVEVDSISAPGGRWNARVAEACARAGYRHLYHSNSWASARSLEGLSLRGRLMVTRKLEPEELERAMRTRGMRRLLLQARYSTKEGIRSALGDRLYHKIWCWLTNWDPEDGMEVGVEPSTRPREC
jgi:peptidoglycan/xylan/chitin deacetylase (PgdA/CDA1 family)